MRIISGTLRGKKLFTPCDMSVRPTTDRARESLYNILNSKLSTSMEELTVLDIFSGSGAFGLEAASRGAKTVTFIDKDLTLTQKNATLCGFKNLSFIKKDATKLSPAPKAYDLIFLDAPYNQGLTEKVLITLLTGNWCHTETLLIAETEKSEELTIPDKLELIDDRTYGIARFRFLKLHI